MASHPSVHHFPRPCLGSGRLSELVGADVCRLGSSFSPPGAGGGSQGLRISPTSHPWSTNPLPLAPPPQGPSHHTHFLPPSSQGLRPKPRLSPSSLSLFLTFCIFCLISCRVLHFPPPPLPACDTLSLFFSLFCPPLVSRLLREAHSPLLALQPPDGRGR